MTVSHKFGKVAVLGGGNSRERNISIQSAEAVLKALKASAIDADFVDTGVLNLEQLKQYDRAFIALHGVGGEDGRIQAVLEALSIPYTGSGVAASAIAMDKVLSKKLWLSSGLPVPESSVANDVREAQNIAKQLGYPVMLKPSLEGSSVGISLVESEEQIEKAFVEANLPGQKVLVEQYIQGEEYSVGILGAEVLPSVRLETKRAFYDYQAKYIDNDTKYFCPSGLSGIEEESIASLATEAFACLSCSGWGRVDFMRDSSGNFFLLEINTVPGLTSHSLVPMEANVQGYGFPDLIIKILETSFGQGEN